jgi:hypothetical protein
MTFHCRNDLPQGYDPSKYNFGCNWASAFMTRHHLAIRRKTNKKKTSIFHRLHKIKNYHFYCVFKLADSDISSTETESSSEESESSTEQSDSDDEVTTDESESS